MTRDGFSTSWTVPRAGVAALLALASACGARQGPVGLGVPDPRPAPGAPLDEAGCLALLVPEPAERSRCEGDARGPCVNEISLEQIQQDPPLHVCFVLVTHENWAAEDGEDEMLVSTEGSYTLAVIGSDQGAWSVLDQKQSPYWSQEIETTDASITIESLGPAARAVVASERRGMGAYSDTQVTFYLVTSQGMAEILAYDSVVRDEGKKEVSYHIDEEATTDGHHDIVLTVEQESFMGEDEGEDGGSYGGEDESWVERYRWNGKEYEQVENTVEDGLEGEDEGE
jgi:hypothetical protein